ncbi:MAG: AraC family transcriptional regulator [Planctomycetota bacterium]
MSHPIDSGNRGTIFSVPSDTLIDLVSDHDPARADDPDSPFPFMSGPSTRRIFWRHRELLKRLEHTAGLDPDPMWVDETSLDLMADALATAFALRAEPRKRRRSSTVVDQVECVEAAKSFLASQMTEPLSLDDVARHVGLSPYHLSRIFREHTGVPVHRYLTRLRLRDALERLANGAEDLTDLALDLGYASHSHFTDTFRREFGMPPSAVRAALRGGLLPKASKIPEA